MYAQDKKTEHKCRKILIIYQGDDALEHFNF